MLILFFYIFIVVKKQFNWMFDRISRVIEEFTRPLFVMEVKKYI